ncbi:MAG: T9SS type A sorting domain-containing protein, partial [Cytophagales bacterium]|nr:T9SS type A sorting domain-containing protein [Cytophagales bacterium]
DDAVTNQSNNSVSGPVQQYNIRYINHLIWNCSESSFCIFLRPSSLTGSVLKNIYFENNTCVNAGGGWGGLQRPDKKGFQVYFSATTAATDSIFIRNNIFYGSRSVLFIDNSGIQPFPYVTMDYNNWYTQNNTDTIAAFWTPSAISVYTKTQFMNYQTDHQKDQHSFMGDPLLANPSSNDYRLSPTSPCVNAGIYNGITSDFIRSPRPQGPNNDIGAYEIASITSLEVGNDIHPGFKVYPNSNLGIFTISTHTDDGYTLRIYDVNGHLAFNQQLRGTTEVDASILQAGIYLICLGNNDAIGPSQKLIVLK